MALLFRLPLLLIELLLRRLLGRDGDDDTWAAAPTAPPESPAARATPQPGAPAGAAGRGAPSAPAAPSAAAARTEAAPPPPTAQEAIDRRNAREATAAAAPPPEPLEPLRPVGDDGHVDREATVVESFGPADDVGGTITVDEPWPGYDAQPASAIVQRVRVADGATKAVVRLYEQQHKARSTVLRATG
jgi:hypothetical protein